MTGGGTGMEKNAMEKKVTLSWLLAFYGEMLTENQREMARLHWEEDLSKRTYTIAFNANGGDGSMSSMTFRHAVSQTLTKNAFTRAKYTFVGWATTPNGGVEYSDGQNIAVTSDLTLFAKWEENQPIWTIRNDVLTAVDLNGVTDITIPESVKHIGNRVFYSCGTLTRQATAQQQNL